VAVDQIGEIRTCFGSCIGRAKNAFEMGTLVNYFFVGENANKNKWLGRIKNRVPIAFVIDAKFCRQNWVD
jgi:hypothetical protein